MEAGYFNLQSEIENYLKRLQIKGNLSHNDAMEIETHIRDGVDSLTDKGLSEEEAFLITLKRTGNAETLSEEYNKINSFFVSENVRTYSILSLGLILSLGTIFLFLYSLVNNFRTAYLAQTTADTIVKAFLYFSLCIAILMVLKWGKSFTIFLQNSIDRRPFLTAAMLFLIPLLSFSTQTILIGYFDKRGLHNNVISKMHDINKIAYVNFSFYLIIISAFFAVHIWFQSIMQKRLSGEKGFLKSSVTLLIIFSLTICLAAGMTRYLHQNNSGFQNSIFFALIFSVGSFSIALYNNEHLWAKLLIFSLFSLFLGNLLIV
jgi:hypothetical protein